LQVSGQFVKGLKIESGSVPQEAVFCGANMKAVLLISQEKNLESSSFFGNSLPLKPFETALCLF